MLFIVHLLKSVELVVEGVSVHDHPGVRILLQCSFKGPFAVHKAHVAQFVVVLQTDWAAKFIQFVF